jgi:hypothetical protein
MPANIDVEVNPPCGDGDILIAVGTRCVPLSTQHVHSQVVQANNDPNSALPEPLFSASGSAISCWNLASSVTARLKLVGTVNFFDSTIGDLHTNQTLVCQ